MYAMQQVEGDQILAAERRLGGGAHVWQGWIGDVCRPLEAERETHLEELLQKNVRRRRRRMRN